MVEKLNTSIPEEEVEKPSLLIPRTRIDTSQVILRHSDNSKQESLFRAARERNTAIDSVAFNPHAFDTTPGVAPERLHAIIFDPLILHQRGGSAHDVQGVRINIALSNQEHVEKFGIIKFHPTAQQEFQNTLAVREKGIHTTVPLVTLAMGNPETGEKLECVVLELDPHLLASSVLSSSFWMETNEEKKLRNTQLFLQNVAKEFGKTHGKGIIHNDPQLKNIALDVRDASMRTFLFDWESLTIVPDTALADSVHPSEAGSTPAMALKDTFADDIRIFGRNFFDLVFAKNEIASLGSSQNQLVEDKIMTKDKPLTFGTRLDSDIKKIVNSFHANLEANSALRQSITDIPSFLAAYEKTLIQYFSPEKANTMLDVIKSQFQFDPARTSYMLKKQFNRDDPEKNQSSAHLEDKGKQATALLMNFKKLGILSGMRKSLINFTFNDFWKEFHSDFLEKYYTSLAMENIQVSEHIEDKKEMFEEYIKSKILTDFSEI